MKVVYLSNIKIYSGQFDSQILKLLENVSKVIKDVGLISFYDIKNSKYAKTAEIKAIKSLNDRNYISFVVRPFFFLGRKFYLKKVENVLLKMNLLAIEETVVLHSQNYLMSYVACRLSKKYKNIKSMLDIKGAAGEEILVYSTSNTMHKYIKYFIAQITEKYIVINCDVLCLLSEYFKKYLIMKYKFDYNKITLVPTCVDTNTFHYCQESKLKMRRKLGYTINDIVLVFSGSAQSWQLPESLIDCFRYMNEKNKNVKLLILSKQKDIFDKLLVKKNIDKAYYKTFSLEYNEVSLYLNAADIGMLLRNDDHINRVANPTKFPEYLSCGLKVLITDSIGDSSYFARQHNAGWIINNITDWIKTTKTLDTVLKDYQYSDKESLRLSELSKKNYSWENFINIILSLYYKLNDSQ